MPAIAEIDRQPHDKPDEQPRPVAESQSQHQSDIDQHSQEVLGRNSSPFDRSIDMHISNLRKKLGPRFGATERIKTVRGVGYIYAQPSAADGA